MGHPLYFDYEALKHVFRVFFMSKYYRNNVNIALEYKTELGENELDYFSSLMRWRGCHGNRKVYATITVARRLATIGTAANIKSKWPKNGVHQTPKDTHTSGAIPGACQSVKIRAHHIVGGIPTEQDLANHS